MGLLKCKMCGGDLDLKEGATLAECLYCGTKQTVPKIENKPDGEKKATLFSRANRLRFSCEFDKAAALYENIVAEFPEEAEAYWGLVLCKYGVEYVDDPATAKKIPTCHRTSYDSVLEDGDFEQTLENADPSARAVYRAEAKQIEQLRQSIIEVSGKEEPYDIFICYKEKDFNGERTLDSVIAQDVYSALTEKGYRVFFSRITLEDKLGTEYEPYIFAALNSAKIMLAFGSDYEYYNAVWVKNEWSRFLKLMQTDRKKTLVPCYKGIDAYDMPKEFLKLQSQDMGKVGAMQDLLRGIEKILPLEKPVEKITEVKTEKTVEKIVEKVVVKGEGGADTGSLIRRAEMFLEDGDFKNANTYAEKVLDIFPECAEAYLIKLCCDYKLTSREKLGGLSKSFQDNANCKKVLRFADDSLREELNGYAAKVEENVKIAEEQKIAEEKAAEEKRTAELKQLERLRKKYSAVSGIIACGSWHSVGIQSDGKVVAVGKDSFGRCSVSDWRDIVGLACGNHTVGMMSNGKAFAAGDNGFGKCDVWGWRDIISIACGAIHTVAIKSGGTVVACGNNSDGQCNVSNWRDIVAIACGGGHTAGVKSDGTVVAVGDNREGQCNVSGWKNIVAVACGSGHTVGLKSDGTVTAVGDNAEGQCNLSGWRNIIAVACGANYTVGLKADGTVTAVGDDSTGQCNVSGWRNIVAVACGGRYTVGLKSDGTVVAVGDNSYGQCNVKGWKLFNSFDNLEEERREAREKAKLEEQEKQKAEIEKQKAEEERRENLRRQNEGRIKQLNKEKAALEAELASLKGLFTGKRRKYIQECINQIEIQINRLRNSTY